MFVVVPLAILICGHQTDAIRIGICCLIYSVDEITLDNPPRFLIISVERAWNASSVQLAHTLVHLQKP
jgi:hypothetical protein